MLICVTGAKNGCKCLKYIHFSLFQPYFLEKWSALVFHNFYVITTNKLTCEKTVGLVFLCFL